MTEGMFVELIATRPTIYASPVGATRAIVTATQGTVIRVHWIWAAPNELDGWYTATDFAPVS